MHIAVMGSGALGGSFGGRLARAGEEVTFIARGAHLAALREHGLTVRMPEAEDFHLAARATDRPEEIGPVDLVLFCVKSYDLEPAAAAIRPLIGPDTVVLPVQNGIDAAERIARVVGPEPVIGGISYGGGTIEAPGVILVNGAFRRLLVGELEGGSSPRTERIVAALRRAGIVAELHPTIRVALWEKFIAICANAGMTALTRLPVGPILACPETRAMYRGVMEEVEAVARARGIALEEGIIDRLLDVIGGMAPDTYASMYYDLANGRRLELDNLNGALVRLGREAGVPTPLNAAIYAALKPYANGPPT